MSSTLALLRCDPEELACLRLGAWSYHTALVNVVAQNQQVENSPETGTSHIVKLKY